MYAVFCIPKGKHRASDGPCLDPLDYGQGKEPDPHLLLRRGRVGLFWEKSHAEEALRKTLAAKHFPDFLKKHGFVVLECVKRSREESSEEWAARTGEKLHSSEEVLAGGYLG
jgi:hypothetical protein